MRINSRSGFTLVEILVCIAIIAALAALAASVYSGARTSGKATEEITQMHQIGLAANLYHEQSESWPDNTGTLVNAGLLPKDLCFSPLDKFRSGWSNAWLSEWGGRRSSGYLSRVVAFKNSYLSVGDINMGLRERFESIFSEPNAGLFVSLTTSTSAKSKDKNYLLAAPYEGKYRRILLDSSVVTRTHSALELKDSRGKQIEVFSSLGMFCDPSEKWKENLGKTF